MAEMGTVFDLADEPEQAVEKARTALADNGFGIVSEVDVQAILKKKLDADTPFRLILGACAPQFAIQALEADPNVAMLLPCNVSIEAKEGGGSTVRAVWPKAIGGFLPANPQLQTVIDDAQSQLEAAMNALQG